METSEKFRIVAIACTLVAGVTAAASGRTIYVDDGAAGANDGSSWANAFVWLQPALGAAQAGDEIRVGQGLYRPDQGAPKVGGRGGAVEAGREATFALKNGVALLGGFAGVGADDPNARDTQRYETILSGDLRGNDFDLWMPGHPFYESLRTDNSWFIVVSSNTDATAVLDGFVIQSAGNSALSNQEGSPHIANCVFRKGTIPSRGGALTCLGGRPVLSNCLFEGNCSTHAYGGAIYAARAHLTLSDCRFLDNWARAEGGAIYSTEADLALTRCTFQGNAASEGGAIHQTGGTVTLVECVFEGNAANSGGAAAFAVRTATMTRCTFVGNRALASGGALESAETPLTVTDCLFSGNTAGNGGVLYAFRLRTLQTPPSLTASLTRCFFTGNRALSMGGALHSAAVEFTIHGCTFADNQASTAGNTLIGDAACLLRMDNCIVWDGRKSMVALLSTRRGALEAAEPNAVVRYSDIQGGWPGAGNIDADPCFAAPGHWVDAANPAIVVPSNHANAAWIDGDYHLKSEAGRWDPVGEAWVLDEVTSPCIDAGDPNSPVGNEPEPNGGRMNMGAYGGTAEASRSDIKSP